MDHLFWEELGGILGTPISTNHNTNYDLFQNIEGRYWSSEADPNNSSKALSFVFNGFVYNNGNSFSDDKRTGYYAMAVTPGSIVPEPETYAMLMAGLGLRDGECAKPETDKLRNWYTLTSSAGFLCQIHLFQPSFLKLIPALSGFRFDVSL